MNIRKKTIYETCGLVPASEIKNDEKCYYLQFEWYRPGKYSRTISILQSSQVPNVHVYDEILNGTRKVIRMARNRRFYYRFMNKSIVIVEQTDDKNDE